MVRRVILSNVRFNFNLANFTFDQLFICNAAHNDLIGLSRGLTSDSE